MAKYIANPVEVDAFEIVAVFMHPAVEDISRGLDLKLSDGSVEHVTPEMCSRYVPVIGDYYVVQSDGYVYLNPKEVFERKYRPA